MFFLKDEFDSRDNDFDDEELSSFHHLKHDESIGNKLFLVFEKTLKNG